MEEKQCLEKCVKTLHNVNEATLRFFRDFESDMAVKQDGLVSDLADDYAKDKAEEKRVARETFKKKSGYVRL